MCVFGGGGEMSVYSNWVQWVGVGKVWVGIVSGHSVRVNEMVV